MGKSEVSQKGFATSLKNGAKTTPKNLTIYKMAPNNKTARVI